MERINFIGGILLNVVVAEVDDCHYAQSLISVFPLLSLPMFKAIKLSIVDTGTPEETLKLQDGMTWTSNFDL